MYGRCTDENKSEGVVKESGSGNDRKPAPTQQTLTTPDI